MVATPNTVFLKMRLVYTQHLVCAHFSKGPIVWTNFPHSTGQCGVSDMSRLMTKPTKWCAPSKDSDQPGHPPSLIKVFAVHLISTKDPSFLHADSEDWSDWADAQTDLSFHWAHRPYCWFCCAAAHMFVIYWWTIWHLILSSPEPKAHKVSL